jgi:hypothetical protein
METIESVSVGIASIALLTYLAWSYGPSEGSVYGFVFFFGCICSFLFLFYTPYRLRKGARNTEYMVTNQRVFFETLGEYAFEEFTNMMGGPRTIKVVNLEDVQEVYVKRGVHERIFGTSTLYVLFRGFQRTTKHWGAEGQVILFHNPPSFAFIKEAYKVQEIIQEAAGIVEQMKTQTAPLNSDFSLSPVKSEFGKSSPLQKRVNSRKNVALVLGSSLLLAGAFVFLYGYATGYTPYVSYDNGYTYIDYVALFSLFPAFAVLLILVFFVLRPKLQQMAARPRHYRKLNFTSWGWLD